MRSFVEFEASDAAAYVRLEAVVDALASAKREDDFRDDAFWKGFFDAGALARFWWPTEAERADWLRRWQATPVSARATDPTLRTPWDFGSMIDAFRDGEYDLIGLRRVDANRARLEFEPHAYPYGGPGCMCALIEAFGFVVERIEE